VERRGISKIIWIRCHVARTTFPASPLGRRELADTDVVDLERLRERRLIDPVPACPGRSADGKIEIDMRRRPQLAVFPEPLIHARIDEAAVPEERDAVRRPNEAGDMPILVQVL